MTTPAAKYAAAKSRSKHQVTSDFIAQFDFAFDQFQIEACHAVESGHGVLVAAPTGGFSSTSQWKEMFLHNAHQGFIKSEIPRVCRSLWRR